MDKWDSNSAFSTTFLRFIHRLYLHLSWYLTVHSTTTPLISLQILWQTDLQHTQTDTIVLTFVRLFIQHSYTTYPFQYAHYTMPAILFKVKTLAYRVISDSDLFQLLVRKLLCCYYCFNASPLPFRSTIKPVYARTDIAPIEFTIV